MDWFTVENRQRNTFAAIRERLLRVLHVGGKMDWDSELTGTTAGILLDAWRGAAPGIDFQDVDYKDPKEARKRAILSNTYLVSGYKSFHNIREYKNLLIDPASGELRSRSAYSKLMREVDARYNRQWIEAEFTHAQQSAINGAKWREFQADKDEFDLVYDAVGDGQTSDLCRSLDGIVKPADDPFWDRYVPGCHWACRSTIRQVPKGTAGKSVDLRSLPKQQPFFQHNPGKTGIIFPKSHRYFNVPRGKKQVIRGRVKELLVSLFSF